MLQHIQGPQDVLVGNSKVTPKGKSIKATKTFKALSITNTSNVEEKERTNMEEKKPNPRSNGILIGRKSRSQIPPFLLTFENFNRNVHNCLVDYGTSSNVMPYLVCKKLNAEPQMSKTKIIQLDRSHVKVFRELKDVPIRLSSNSKVHQIIDIIVVDILEKYGVILSRDLSGKLNGYFSTDWSHLWLPYKGQPNKIKIDQENYMKHMVTNLNDSNEMVMFSRSNLGNFYFDTFFEELEDELSHTVNLHKQSKLLHSNQISKLNYTLVDHSNDASIVSSSCALVNSSFTNPYTQITNHNLRTLYFDTSRNTQGVDVVVS